MIYKFLFFLVFFTLSLFGRYDAVAVKNCPAFDNMKHTRNTDSAVLHSSERYTILRVYQGQMLVLLKGENPAQRWVESQCFSNGEKHHTHNSIVQSSFKRENEKRAESKLSQKSILALSWHNAFCETHRKNKACQREWRSLFGKQKGRDNFVLHGLWPQPKSRVYCGVERRYISADRYGKWNRLPEPKLSQETKDRLKKVMPGTDSNLHRHEWIKHGTCYGTDAERYFKHAVTLAKEVENSEVAHFFQAHTGRRIGIEKVRALFDRSFGRGAGAHVELRCRNGLITELWLHLGEGGSGLAQMLQTGKRVQSHCRYGIVDGAGY